MRVMMKVTIPVDAGNEAVRNGSLASTMKAMLEDLRPESVYFTAVDGQRTGFIVLQMQESNEMVRAAEPWFLAFDADVEFHLAMTPEDLGKAGPYLEAAAKKFG